MGLRFSKRVTLLPGVRVNLSGSGLGLSLGPRGASVSVGRSGVYGNLGIPGTGLSYRTKLSGGSAQQRSTSRQATQPVQVIVTLSDDGELSFRDETGAPVPPAIVKQFKAENRDAIQGMLEAAAVRMNEDLEACLNIHMGTPAPGSVVPAPAAFDESSKPVEPPHQKIGFFDRLFGKAAAIEERNRQIAQGYQENLSEWYQEQRTHETRRAQIVDAMKRLPQNDVPAMEVVAEYLLDRITWPRVTNIGFGISACGRVVGIDLDLPDEDEIPATSAVVGKDRLNFKKRSEAQSRRDFVFLAYASAFRVAGELFAGLPTIDKVVISSYVQRKCTGTAQIRDEYVMSTIVDRAGWGQINFSQLSDIDPASTIGMFPLRVKLDRSSRLQEITPFEMSDSYA